MYSTRYFLFSSLFKVTLYISIKIVVVCIMYRYSVQFMMNILYLFHIYTSVFLFFRFYLHCLFLSFLFIFSSFTLDPSISNDNVSLAWEKSIDLGLNRNHTKQKWYFIGEDGGLTLSNRRTLSKYCLLIEMPYVLSHEYLLILFVVWWWSKLN